MSFRYQKNIKKKIIAGIFYKCGYSSFMSSNFFDRVVLKKTPKYIIETYNDWEIFICIRNPYNRIYSLYKDKVIINTHVRINRGDNTLQKCQKLICFANNIKEDLKELQKISFDDFCKNLHKIYLKDLHFIPFSNACYYNNKIITNNILDIDNLNIEYLNKIGINMKHVNKTDSIKDNLYTKETKDIIYNLYKKDFDLYKYVQ